MIKRICKTCGKEFGVYPFKIRIGKGKFCSQKCSYIAKKELMKGNKFSIGRLPNKTSFKKGIIPFYKGKKNPKISGKNHYNWQGGKIILSRGYVLIHKPEHPFAIAHGYIYEHRLVMEQYLRKNHPNHPALIEIKGVKYLKPKWRVHHKGIKYLVGSIENKGDNRIKNLQLFANHSEHRKFHGFLSRLVRCHTLH